MTSAAAMVVPTVPNEFAVRSIYVFTSTGSSRSLCECGELMSASKRRHATIALYGVQFAGGATVMYKIISKGGGASSPRLKK